MAPAAAMAKPVESNRALTAAWFGVYDWFSFVRLEVFRAPMLLGMPICAVSVVGCTGSMKYKLDRFTSEYAVPLNPKP